MLSTMAAPNDDCKYKPKRRRRGRRKQPNHNLLYTDRDSKIKKIKYICIYPKIKVNDGGIKKGKGISANIRWSRKKKTKHEKKRAAR